MNRNEGARELLGGQPKISFYKSEDIFVQSSTNLISAQEERYPAPSPDVTREAGKGAALHPLQAMCQQKSRFFPDNN